LRQHDNPVSNVGRKRILAAVALRPGCSHSTRPVSTLCAMTDARRRRWLIELAVAAVAAPLVFRRWHAAGTAPAKAAPPTPAPPVAERFPHLLRRPGDSGLLAECDLAQPLNLHAKASDFEIFDGPPTTLWNYAAKIGERNIANPLLHVRSGDSLDVTLVNELDEPTTLHWHGFAVDEANDGSGLHPVPAATQARYAFRVSNRAGLYWYHAHPHGRTGVQVQRGLAGPLLIDDAEESALRAHLGLRWNERDLLLMISDRQMDARNAIVYPQADADDWIGNRALVNWTPDAHIDAVRGMYRLRLANVANARLWRLAFQHRGGNLPFQLIGTDGGLLAQACSVEDLFLAPAQRADVLVDFSEVPAGERVLLRSLDYLPMDNDDDAGGLQADPMADHPGAMPMGTALDVMEFRIAGATVASPALPSTLSTLPPPPQTAGWPVRPFVLHMDKDGIWLINEWNFHKNGHAPSFAVKRGSREVWEIRNAMTSMPHPIHVHGFQFRVISRSISPMDIRARQVAPGGLLPHDMGLNDTVLVWPGEVVRIAMDFSQPYRGTQHYMLHCHNLEHEDRGMMVTFAVTD
jgi:blue copper oxidase